MASCDNVFDKVVFDRYQTDYYNDIDDVILNRNQQAFVSLIREAITNEFDETDKKIIYLYWFKGLKQKDVALILRMPHYTVSRHLVKINEVLYEKLKYAVKYRFGFAVHRDTSLIEIALAVAKGSVSNARIHRA